jgi:hypothetical protein
MKLRWCDEDDLPSLSPSISPTVGVLSEANISSAQRGIQDPLALPQDDSSKIFNELY